MGTRPKLKELPIRSTIGHADPLYDKVVMVVSGSTSGVDILGLTLSPSGVGCWLTLWLSIAQALLLQA